MWRVAINLCVSSCVCKVLSFFFFSTVPLVQAEHLFPDKADVDELQRGREERPN